MMLKRAFDVTISAVVLVITAPIVAAAALAILIADGRPVVFTQTRPGLNGEPFDIRKFRTLTNATDASGQLLPDDERRFRVGELLRTTSIDELPALVNVLRGEMSLVGPRPLLMEYLDLYTEEHMRRHEARPGLTGLAQVNGRNGLSWRERFDLDVFYVDHQSLRLDLDILWKTVRTVTSRDNIYAADGKALERFTGDLDA